MRLATLQFVALIWLIPGQARPQLTELRTDHAQTDGHFGVSCAVDNGIVAVLSEERLSNPTEYGAVSIYERDAIGLWTRVQWLRRHPDFNLGGAFTREVRIAGDSLLAMSGGDSVAFEYRRVMGQWVAHERIPTPSGGLYLLLGFGYDGATIVTGYHQAGNGFMQQPGQVMFWSRGPSWAVQQTFRPSDIGLTGPSVTTSLFGAEVSVHDDVTSRQCPLGVCRRPKSSWLNFRVP